MTPTGPIHVPPALDQLASVTSTACDTKEPLIGRVRRIALSAALIDVLTLNGIHCWPTRLAAPAARLVYM